MFLSYSRADKAQAIRLAKALQGAPRRGSRCLVGHVDRRRRRVREDHRGGDQHLRYSGRGVAAAAGVAGLVAWRKGLHLRVFSASGNSVAVLPFENVGGNPEQDYFAEGLAEEVRATLARNVGLLVMAQASSAKFRDIHDDATTIAERAIAIAPDLSDAHSTLGFTLFQGRLDARAAREPFERSNLSGFGEATVLARYSRRALSAMEG